MNPVISKWYPGAEWPKPLPASKDEIKAFVARLRTRIIRDCDTQNDVDEACHLIESLCNALHRLPDGSLPERK